MSLIKRSSSATFWCGVDVFVRQFFLFCFSLLLARLLDPEHFGAIAILYLFFGIASTFVDGGFSSALIQRQDTNHTDESTVFWFNLGMGITIAMLVWLLGPYFLQFFDIGVLIPLTWVLALNILFASLGSIHCALLTKQLNFKLQMIIGLVATAVSGLFALLMAIGGFGIWALAAQALLSSGITTCLFWYFNPWRPAFQFSLHSARELFAFGGYFMASGLIDVAYAHAYYLLIGKIYGMRILGVYERANNSRQMPVSLLSHILSSVAFPIFSIASKDKPTLRYGLRFATRTMMFINVPVMLGLALVSEPLVLVLLGEKWLSVAPIFQALCIGSTLWPLHVINLSALVAQGRSKLCFLLDSVNKLFGCVLLISASLIYGVDGVAWSLSLFYFFCFVLTAHYSRLYIDYGPVAQAHDILPTLCISLVTLLTAQMIINVLNASAICSLIITFLFGSSMFVTLSYALKLKELYNILRIVMPNSRFSAATTELNIVADGRERN